VKGVPRRGRFFGRRRTFRAVDDLSFSIQPGEIFSLVGESGCGKTTTARCVLRPIEPTSGEIHFKDVDLRPRPGASFGKRDGTCRSYFRIRTPP
jgi:ABC-type oligopeptide transport system ATPase subunit